jgi:hypothetical protein
MAFYTLHLPANARPGEIRALDQARLLRDGFSVWAFLFPVLWFFWHRLWLAGLGTGLVLVVLGVIVTMCDLPGFAGSLTFVLLSGLVGLEARVLESWTLRRNGLAEKLIVQADNPEEAAAKAFRLWLENPAPEPARDWPKGPVFAIQEPMPGFSSPLGGMA